MPSPTARVSVYDTSGPYTDPAAVIDVKRGLPSMRGAWIAERGDTDTTRAANPWRWTMAARR